MPWRDWSDYKRAQVVNALTVPCFLIGAFLSWHQGSWPWPLVWLAAALVNTVGGLWRAVTTSPLSLARLLWFYGEDSLWERALALSPGAVADLAPVFGELRLDGARLHRLWPDGPRDSYLLLPVIELLERVARPAARTRRRPKKQLPDVLDVAEEVRWSDPQFREVSRLVDAKLHGTA